MWLLAALALLGMAVAGAEPSMRLYYSNVLQTVISAVSGLMCLSTMRAFPVGTPLRRAWGLIGAGVLAWSMGSTVFSTYPLLHGGAETPYPYVSDVGFLLTSPLIALGLYAFKRGAQLKSPMWGKVLAIALLLGMGYWCYLANAEGLASGDPALIVTSLGYMLLDPILLAVTVLTASSFTGGVIGRAWWMVLAGVLLYFVGNQLYSYLVAQETYQTGSIIDLGWVLSFGLIGLAALTTRRMMTA